MATHSSTLAWKIPWMEEPGRLQSMGSGRGGHDRATSLSLFTFMHWRRKWQPIPVSCLENPRGGGTWWAAIYGVAQSRTRLKRLSSSNRHQETFCCLFFIIIILPEFLRACDGSVKIFYFFLVQFWKIVLSKNLSISSTLSILLAYNC